MKLPEIPPKFQEVYYKNMRNEISLEIKTALQLKALELLEKQLNTIKEQLSDLKEAGAKESKSSAGDKFETQREMIKQSRDLLDNQLSRQKKMFLHLQKLPVQVQKSVMEGTLMKLPIGCIWISVPMGKLILNGMEYQLVSKESPLFIALKNLKTGDSVFFRGRNLKIDELI